MRGDGAVRSTRPSAPRGRSADRNAGHCALSVTLSTTALATASTNRLTLLSASLNIRFELLSRRLVHVDEFDSEPVPGGGHRHHTARELHFGITEHDAQADASLGRKGDVGVDVAADRAEIGEPHFRVT